MPKYKERRYNGLNVYDAALERMRYIYKRFDRVCVSFSGGKDSTAMLNVTIEVARELGRLPVHVVFVDEEAIPTQTIEYVARVRERPEVKLDWYCLPVKHRNACSFEQPYWYCWHPNEREKWVREMPPWAITNHPKFEWGMTYQEWASLIYSAEGGSVAMLVALRAEESLRRYRVITCKRNDSYIASKKEGECTYRCYPLYDWRSSDVWRLIHEKGYDYNKSYDLMNKTELYNRHTLQRICQPFGEEPLRSMWLWAECWPDMWPKMLARVPGVATAWRYANTDLYLINNKPDELTWQQHTYLLLEQYSNKEGKKSVRTNLQAAIKRHRKSTADPIPEEEPHPLTGFSWKFLAKMVGVGDFKGRRIQNVVGEVVRIQQKLGITKEEAQRRYGRGPAD